MEEANPRDLAPESEWDVYRVFCRKSITFSFLSDYITVSEIISESFFIIFISFIVFHVFFMVRSQHPFIVSQIYVQSIEFIIAFITFIIFITFVTMKLSFLLSCCSYYWSYTN